MRISDWSSDVCSSDLTTGERRMVYRISITLVITLVALAGLMPDPFNDVVQEMVRHLVRDAGWTYLVVVFVTLLFLLYLALGRFGRLPIGGQAAEPAFSSAERRGGNECVRTCRTRWST